MAMRILFGLTLAIGCLAGCSASPVVQQPSPSWIRSNGGTTAGDELTRVRAVGDRFVSVVDHPFQLHVLQNREPTALAWPNGDVFLTSGLVQILSDDEIAGVIGHELGHLIRDHPSAGGASLTGHHDHAQSEIHADDAGLALLTSTGTPQKALRSALQKVLSYHELKGITPRQLAARIARLP